MPYFGVPIRNGLPIGLGTLTALAKAVAVVVPPVSSDPFFEYVSLLLNTTSTNGAQNNTFLDSSTNAFSITRNGNTTQGTFSPFSQTGWSNYFDGTGDFLTAPSNTAFDLGSGDFTIESWIHVTSNTPTNQFIYSKRANNAAYSPILLYITKVGALYRLIYAGSFNGSTWGLNTSFISGTIDIQLNSWAHVALVRSGSTFTSFVNGVVDQTFTGLASALMTNTDAATVAAEAANGGNAFNGYISNVRIVKGTAVYTANFTPPTSPLTAISGTSLLTCQSNRFIDNSSNAFAITRNGDVSVQAFSPFNPTAAWSASTNGGSGYFDGNGDELNAGSNAAFSFGTGAYTVEAWVYLTAAVSATHQPMFVCNHTTNGFTFWNENTLGQLQIASSGIGAVLSSATTLSPNIWNHIVAVRSGTGANQTAIFVNGTRVANGTDATNWSITGPLKVGGITAANYYLTGYASNVRVVKGTAVYDPTLTTLTVPTAPLTAITNTSLLLNFTNAGIFDSASGNDLETVGNAQVSTVQAKWGTTSMAFDGTGDWLVVPDGPTQRLGSGDFTVEMWLYKTGGLPPGGIIGKGTSTTGWELSWQTGNTLRFTFGSTATTSVATINNNTWYHLALVRSGSATGNVKLYLDGTLIATSGTAVTDNLNQTNVMYVGANRTGANAFTGYIDDLRITNGYARYTANFTPPTAAFPLN